MNEYAVLKSDNEITKTKARQMLIQKDEEINKLKSKQGSGSGGKKGDDGEAQSAANLSISEARQDS